MTVDHPDYYRKGTGHEAIDVIEAWGLGFCLGNAVKYIARAGLKGGTAKDVLSDLEKARWYVDREIGKVRKEIEETDLGPNGDEPKPVGLPGPDEWKVRDVLTSEWQTSFEIAERSGTDLHTVQGLLDKWLRDGIVARLWGPGYASWRLEP